MRNSMRVTLCGLGTLAGLSVVGCAPPTIPVPVDLSGSSAGEYEVTAGVPVQKSGARSFSNQGIQVGSGTFEIDPSVIQVTPSDAGSSKRRVAAQMLSCNEQVVADGLFDTCIDGGGTEAECSEQVRQAILDCLGDVNTLEITGWIGSQDELETIFETGDRYGTYRVTINEAGQGVSVTPSTITLTEKTIGLLNDGNFAFGFEVVYGEDAIITVGSFTLNVGL